MGLRIHMRCTRCSRVDPIRLAGHAWTRPGRRAAHDRPAVCAGGEHGDLECEGRTVPPVVRYDCEQHGRGPHGLRVRARGGLALVCRACAREEVAAREIDPEVAREAARAYYRRVAASRRKAVRAQARRERL